MTVIKAFDSAYPGSMFERKDGGYVERDDHNSLAAALIYQIDSRNRDIEDLRTTLENYDRLTRPDWVADAELLTALKNNSLTTDQRAMLYMWAKGSAA